MADQILRRTVKAVAASACHYTGLRKVMSAVRRHQSGGRRISIVSYHRVVEDFTGELQRSIPGLLISKETFRKHLEEAHAAGYQFATVGEAVDVMAGRKVAKKDLIVITFDDGYRDVFRHGLPILKAMGVPATVYLPTDFVGTDRRFNHDRLFHLIRVARARRFRPEMESLPPEASVLLEPIFTGRQTPSAALDDFIGIYPTRVLTTVIDALEKQLGGGPELTPEQGDVMSWDEARALARGGIELGAHTRGHVVLTLEDLATAEAEIVESKRRIEAEVGAPCRDFAYCNGWYSDEIIQLLARHGFRSGVTTEDLLNRIGGDPFTLKRKVLWENFSTGMLGEYSPSLTACQLDDVFGLLGMNHPVLGRRPQRGSVTINALAVEQPAAEGV